MTRGNAQLSKVHFQGKEEDFIVYVDNAEAHENWKKDRSIPLAQVLNGFKIFVTHKYVLFSLFLFSFILHRAYMYLYLHPLVLYPVSETNLLFPLDTELKGFRMRRAMPRSRMSLGHIMKMIV